MADKEEFLFEEDDSAPPGNEEAAPTGLPDPGEEAAVPTRKVSVVRILVLVGLLVVLGGVGFFYLGGLPELAPPPPPPPPPKKQAIAVPPTTVAPAPAPPAGAPAPTPAKPQPVAGNAPVAVKPAGPAQTAPPAATIPAARLEPAAVPAPVRTPAPQAPPAAPAAAQPTGAAVAKAAPSFQLDAGSYLLRGRQAKAEKIVRQLGYQPHLQATRDQVAMTRLKVGSYPLAEARTRLLDVRKLAPDAFLLPDAGGQTALYAGSYFLLNEGRKFADRLYAQGLRVEEVPVKVAVKGQRITFGGFADREEAEQAAQKAKAAGLTVKVIATP